LGGSVKSYVVSSEAVDEAIASGAAAVATAASPAERATAEVEHAEPDLAPEDKDHGTIVPPPAPF
jgi:hypothetical protein